MNKKLLQIFSINFLIIVGLLGAIETLLGSWRSNFLNNEYIQIPGLIKNLTLRYDARWIYSSNENMPIIYHRDEIGYRSREINSNKPLILTIGGSTTDNRFTSEGETWQDLLDVKFPEYDFINGGIDGQSSFGHAISIAKWHSKVLDPEMVEFIIFYIGINDTQLLKNEFNDHDFAQSQIRYLKNILKDNSFFVKRLLILRNRIWFKFDLQKDNYKNLQFSHGKRLPLRKQGSEYKIPKSFTIDSYKGYADIFKNLLSETQKYFPFSTIVIIQQQVPGCQFINKSIVYDKHPNIKSEFCKDLIKVYKIQEKVLLSNFSNKKVKFYPMYLNSYLSYEDVYDNVHTNNNGSKKIADYIEMNKILN